MAASKIYIDPNEDVVFTSAKIAQAPANKVILIVPAGSNIISSQVSAKLLARILSKTPKLVSIVTEDAIGKKFITHAGMVTVDKVSDVNPEIWDKAHELRQSYLVQKDKVKMKLLAERQEDSFEILDKKHRSDEPAALVTPPPVVGEDKVASPVGQALQDQQPLVELGEEEEKADLEITSTDSDLLDKDQLGVATTDDTLTVVPETEAHSELKEVKPLFTKLEPKIIDLNEYALLSGGDISHEKEFAQQLKQKLHFIAHHNHHRSKIAQTERLNELPKKKDSLEPQPSAGDINSGAINTNFNAQGVLAANGTPAPKLRDRVSKLSSSTNTLVHSWMGKVKDYANNSKKNFDAKRATNVENLGKDDIRAMHKPEEHQPQEHQPEEHATRRAPSRSYNRNFANMDYGKMRDSLNASRDRGREKPKRSNPPRRSGGGVGSGTPGNDAGSSLRGTRSGGNGSSLKSLNLQKFKNMADNYWQTFARVPLKTKLLFIGVPVLLLLLFSTVLTKPHAEINLVVAQQSVPISQKVNAKEGIEANLQELTIPFRYVTKTDSRSESVPATGKGESGTKAKGTIKVFNYSDKAFNLGAGTKILSVRNNKEYVLLGAINAPAGSDNQSAPIEAAGFGEEYNLTSGLKEFAIKGQDTTGVTIFTSTGVTGGSKKEVVVVTQQDIDKVKNELIGLIRSTLDTELQSLISTTEVKLSQAIIYADPTVQTSKQVGEEAESFDITVSMEGKMAVVNKADLDALVQAVAERNSGLAGDVKVMTATNSEVSEVALSPEGATFSLSASVDVTAALTESQVKTEVLGLSVSDAETKLENLEDVNEIELKYSPWYIPKFLRKLPKKAESIEITIARS